jgi:hypothetical protein
MPMQRHIRIVLERGALHGREGIGEAGAAVRVDEMVAAMHRRRDRIIAVRRARGRW